MRVEDKEGQYILDPNESRLLLKADPLKGEKPVWRLLPEGIDNDRDKRWNEDGPGGVELQSQLPLRLQVLRRRCGHPPGQRGRDAGPGRFRGRPSEHRHRPDLRGRGQPPQDAQERRLRPGGPSRWRPSATRTSATTRPSARLYRARLGLGKELEGASEPGTFSDWMYFHRGRLSLAARPWDPAAAAVDSAKSQEGSRSKNAGRRRHTETQRSQHARRPRRNLPRTRAKTNAARTEREQLKWFDEHAPDAFVAWQAVEHPDFPGRRVEVGGFRPFVQTNPPAGDAR